MEIGNDGIRYRESVRRENELVGPSVIRLHLVICGDVSLEATHHGHAHSQYLVAFTLGLVDDFDSLRSDDQPFGIHLVLGKVFHIHLAEIADAHVLRDEGFVYVLENHHVEQLAAEM